MKDSYARCLHLVKRSCERLEETTNLSGYRCTQNTLKSNNLTDLKFDSCLRPKNITLNQTVFISSMSHISQRKKADGCKIDFVQIKFKEKID